LNTQSIIKDSSLAESGHLKISWAYRHMPVLRRLEEEFSSKKPLAGERIAICLHLEAKTACLAKLLQDLGAFVAITGSNPLSTQDDVCAALVELGVTVFAKYNPSYEEYTNFLNKTLETSPTLIVDDGGDLVSILHKDKQEFLTNIKGGCEETTTGILRLKALEKESLLKFPMLAVNDAFSKYLFDNRYGTGQSVFDGINNTINLVIAGKTIVVSGYGWCGKGVAMRAKGLGAKVIVTEVNPIKAVEAYMDGFLVMPMLEASKYGDIFITVTGNKNILTKEHFQNMKDGAILANAGHFNVEIDLKALEAMAVEKSVIRKNIVDYKFANGKRLYVLAEGRLVNLAAGDGHPAEIMDMSFSLQTLCLLYLKENFKKLATKVLNVPSEIDEKVSSYFLEAVGVKIDSLSLEQLDYLHSWKL